MSKPGRPLGLPGALLLRGSPADAGAAPRAQAGYLLARVLEDHPGMKLVAAREVERFVFRPGLAERARYYAVVFLNQLPLSHSPAHGAAAPLSRVTR